MGYVLIHSPEINDYQIISCDKSKSEIGILYKFRQDQKEMAISILKNLRRASIEVNRLTA
jgi:hypothetical protein